jgi:decaprenylphospho-beta-D-erythro-pentofuranosid-2-ulose 2-reductase
MRNRPGRPDDVRQSGDVRPADGDALLPDMLRTGAARRADQAARRERELPRKIAVFGATSAIAQAWMRLLAPGGVSFFIVARNTTHLKAVAQDLVTRGADSVYMETSDLDQTAAHPAMLERAVTSLGGLDCALIAHGTLGDQPASEADYATAAASFQTNFLSAVSLVTWLANYFAAQYRGTIAVISSVAGDRGRKSNYVYGSAKAGLNAFLDGVRNRVDREGVQVLTIRPGFVATPMTAHLPQGPLFVTPDQVARDILKAIESRRDVLYTPWFWRWIMALIRVIPEWKFKRMDL